jgi:hypothetical protein
MAAVLRRAVLFAVLALAVAVGVAGAGVPDPAYFRCPNYVDLGGCNSSGQPDPGVSFSVTLRDVGNFPISNHLVTCTFTSDVRIYNSIPGAFVYCPCLEVFTDLAGVATFHVPGGGRNTNGVGGFTGASAVTFSYGNCRVGGTYATAHVTTYD